VAALPITIGPVRYPGIKIHETPIIRLTEVLLHGGTRVGAGRPRRSIRPSSSRAYGLNQLRLRSAQALLQRDGSRCGLLANSRFHHQPKAQHRPNSRLETAYHHADKAIQTVVDLLVAA
jgi:hypothetical protein